VNVAVMLDFSRHMNRVNELNPEAKSARVQPGIVLDDLRKAAGKHGLTFGPDPATHSRNTLGGMIGNNSCGIHSMMSGETVDNIDELDIVTYRGERITVGATSDDELDRIIREGGAKGGIYRKLKALRDKYADRIRKEFPMISRRVSGFNLPALLPEQGFNVAKALVGTECTCALVLEAKTKLVYNPPPLVTGGRLSRYLCGGRSCCRARQAWPDRVGSPPRYYPRLHEKEGPAYAKHGLHAGRTCLTFDRVRRQGQS